MDVENNSMKCYCLIIAIMSIFWTALADSKYDHVAKLEAQFNEGSSVDYHDLDDLQIIANDAGPSVVPYLRQMLLSKDKQKSAIASTLLGDVGGEEAIIALQQIHNAKPGMYLDPLCRAMASRGTQEDIIFLTKALSQPPPNDWWQDRVTAAFSLGILRAKEAVPALYDAASKAHRYELHGAVAEDVIFWILNDPMSVVARDVRPPDRDIISAIIVNGIYGIRGLSSLFDRNLKGYWVRKNDLWTFIRKRRTELLGPEISFNIHLSPDGTRALVRVDLEIETNSGFFYSYVLQKTNHAWKVRSIRLTGGR